MDNPAGALFRQRPERISSYAMNGAVVGYDRALETPVKLQLMGPDDCAFLGDGRNPPGLLQRQRQHSVGRSQRPAFPGRHSGHIRRRHQLYPFQGLVCQREQHESKSAMVLSPAVRLGAEPRRCGSGGRYAFRRTLLAAAGGDDAADFVGDHAEEAEQPPRGAHLGPGKALFPASRSTSAIRSSARRHSIFMSRAWRSRRSAICVASM